MHGRKLMASDSERPRILVVVAAAMTVKAFLLNYLQALLVDYAVTLVCSPDDPDLVAVLPEGIVFIPIKIHRSIKFFRDLKSLFALIRLMRRSHFDMLHSLTPKAGLLAQLAAWCCGVRIRLHTFTGQVWVTRQGVFRVLLKSLDRLIAGCATHLLADSASQRTFLIKEGVVSESKIEVLGAGSLSGVDTHRFRPDLASRSAIRRRLGYTEDHVLALYVGRLNYDKGLLDLVRAFAHVSQRLPQLVLLLVGPDEEGLTPEITRLSGENSCLHLLGGTSAPESFMAAADFFCLPSYREGFGSVVIEAASCGLPAMGSEIYGLTDAIDDEYSGVLHPPGNVDAIANLLERFTRCSEWRKALGEQARQRALAYFSAETVLETQIAFVRSLMSPVSGCVL